MKFSMLKLIVCLIMLFPFFGVASAIEVGVAKIDITPADPVKLWGYSSRQELSTGVLDPLFAKAIVFDDGRQQAVMVIMDAGRTFPEKNLTELKQKLQEKYGFSAVMIAATHTHAAPGYYPEHGNAMWKETTLAKIDDVVKKALSNKKPTVFKTATGLADLSYDRRVVNADGTVTMLWENFDRKFIREVDQKVRALFIEGADGNPIVTLVHYACHPVMTGSKNLKVSADFPAYMAEVVENEIGGMCMFVQGAPGNINPYLAAIVTRDTINGIQAMKEEGYSLGKCVVALHRQAKPLANDSLEIHYSTIRHECGPRYSLEDERIAGITRGLFLENTGTARFYPEISILTLGNEIAWVGFPGEFFDDFQVSLLERSPFEHTYFMGYCNGHYSYFPTIKAAAEGGYGAGYSTLTEAGTGEIMVDKAVVGLFELSGKLENR